MYLSVKSKSYKIPKPTIKQNEYETFIKSKNETYLFLKDRHNKFSRH